MSTEQDASKDDDMSRERIRVFLDRWPPGERMPFAVRALRWAYERSKDGGRRDAAPQVAADDPASTPQAELENY